MAASRCLLTASARQARGRLAVPGARRGYATPLNHRSSLEPALGTAPPSAPRPPDGEQPLSDDAVKRERWLQAVATGSKGGGKAGNQSAMFANLERAKDALLQRQRTAPETVPETGPAEESKTDDAAAMSAPTLRNRVLEAARQLVDSEATQAAISVQDLLSLYHARAGRQLSVELSYESTPIPERRVPGTSPDSPDCGPDEDDGVLLLAYVANLSSDASARGKEKVSLCSAFSIRVEARELDPAEDEPVGHGPVIVTCAHTLTTALPEGSRTDTTATTSKLAMGEPSSIALAITRLGHVYPVRTLLSSLPGSDLVLLQLAEAPVLAPASQPQPLGFFSRNHIDRTVEHGAATSSTFFGPASADTQGIPAIRTLPLSPYPAHPGEGILVSSFEAWDPSVTQADAPGGAYDAADGRGSPFGAGDVSMDLPPERWGRASIIEYKDGAGREARVGTYDDLHQLDFRLTSAPAHLRPKISTVTVPMPDSAEAASEEPTGDVHDNARSALAAFERRRRLREAVAVAAPGRGEEEQDETWEDEETVRRVLPGLARPHNLHLLDKTLATLRGNASLGDDSPLPPRQGVSSSSRTAALLGTNPAARRHRAFPPPGSSGGPIVSARDGCVVGVVRGSRTSVLEGHRGDGVPAEKIFEMFSLPGLGKKKLEERKARASSSQGQSGDRASLESSKER